MHPNANFAGAGRPGVIAVDDVETLEARGFSQYDGFHRQSPPLTAHLGVTENIAARALRVSSCSEIPQRRFSAPQIEKPSFLIGRVRMRCPVTVKIALQTAGAS